LLTPSVRSVSKKDKPIVSSYAQQHVAQQDESIRKRLDCEYLKLSDLRNGPSRSNS